MESVGIVFRYPFRTDDFMRRATTHLVLADFRRSLRDSFRLFDLFDDEHFDSLICGNQFKTNFVKSLFQFFTVSTH